MLSKMMKRTIALALAAVTFGLPLMSNDALAAAHNDKNPNHKVERHMDQRAPQTHKIKRNDHHKGNNKHQTHKPAPKHNDNKPVVVIRDKHPQPNHHPAPPSPPHKDHHSSNDKLAAGLVIGAILGAVIANAN